MRSSNLSLGKGRHLNLALRKARSGPLYPLPALVWLPPHDVNLEIEGFGFALCFLRSMLVVNIRRATRSRGIAVDITRANALSKMIAERLGAQSDPLAIARAFERHPHLREVARAGAEESHYGLRLVRDAAREEAERERRERSIDAARGGAPSRGAPAPAPADINLDSLLKGSD